MKRELNCHCGDTTFSLHLYTLQQVGLLTCSHGHHSLLLDSRDYWREVLQVNRKSRELHCKCKSKFFSVSLFYTFREGSEEVSQVDVITTCTNCRTERRAMIVEIDYGPTELLIDRPLDPCEQPWLKTRQIELSGLWEPKDLELFINWVMEFDGVRAYLITIDGSHSLVNDVIELRNKLETSPAWDLYLFIESTTFPKELIVRWKDFPVVHVWGPMVMVDNIGNTTTMYYIEYAKEVIQGLTVVPQPRKFLAFTKSITGWLRNNFISERGKGTFDNPAEFARIQGNW